MDPAMFFGNFTRDFVDSQNKNDNFLVLGDFAEDTLIKNVNVANKEDLADSCSKNGSFEILGDLADSQHKNGNFVINGFFAFFTHKKGKFRIF